MRKRCNNKNDTVYKYYGGIGIRVCDKWNDNYEEFEKWAYENGYDETAPRGLYTIDRINPYKDYSPENCRWISIREQQHNKRKNWIKNEDNMRQP